jgi:hypothetical protein
LKPTAIAPSITMNDVKENYKKQEVVLFESWLWNKAGRSEISDYRANLQRSFEAVETAYPSLKDVKFYQYTDEARQLTVSYLQQNKTCWLIRPTYQVWALKRQKMARLWRR